MKMISRKALLCVILVLLTACTSLGEFPVNTYTTGEQANPAVAMDAGGNFVVVWESKDQDGSGRGVYGQRFNIDAQPVGGEFRVNTTTDGNQKQPDVAMGAGGNFVVAWASGDGSGEGIFARRYDSNGLPLTSELAINTNTHSRQMRPSVGMNDTGEFAITWERWNDPTEQWFISRSSLTVPVLMWRWTLQVISPLCINGAAIMMTFHMGTT
jgi:hypothetical protein